MCRLRTTHLQHHNGYVNCSLFEKKLWRWTKSIIKTHIEESSILPTNYLTIILYKRKLQITRFHPHFSESHSILLFIKTLFPVVCSKTASSTPAQRSTLDAICNTAWWDRTTLYHLPHLATTSCMPKPPII